MKILAKKLKMTQIWQNDKVIPVTPLELKNKLEEIEKLKVGKIIKISGLSKGKGFQGVVKRWGFHGGPKSHGQKDRLRAPGSLGPTAPQRVIKGRKMAGHMGLKRITLKKQIVSQDKEKNLILVKGPVPGMTNSLIEISLFSKI